MKHQEMQHPMKKSQFYIPVGNTKFRGIHPLNFSVLVSPEIPSGAACVPQVTPGAWLRISLSCLPSAPSLRPALVNPGLDSPSAAPPVETGREGTTCRRCRVTPVAGRRQARAGP